MWFRDGKSLSRITLATVFVPNSEQHVEMVGRKSCFPVLSRNNTEGGIEGFRVHPSFNLP